MTFKNLSSTGRSHAVKEQILAAITNGEYGPGDKLPSESELGGTIGVSRVSIREALRSLEAVGLIEIHHGRGSFVAMGPRDRYQSPFVGWLQVHRDEILDLMKVRGALDELAAAEAATNADGPALAAVDDAQERFRVAARNPEAAMDELIEADVAFHIAIARASGSSLLLDLLHELNKLFAESRNALFSLGERASRSVGEHDAIVEAIRSGSATAARSMAAHHLESTRRTLTSSDFLQRLAGVGQANQAMHQTDEYNEIKGVPSQ